MSKYGPLVQGTVRDDGLVFIGYRAEKNGKVYERWGSVELYWSRRAMTDAAAKAWIKAHPERRNKRASAYHKEERRRDPRRLMVQAAKCRAKKIGIPFSITKDDIVIPETCPAIGIPICVGSGVMCDGSPTIDRICPELGYRPGNVVVVSYKANRIKNNATIAELLSIAKYGTKPYKPNRKIVRFIDGPWIGQIAYIDDLSPRITAPIKIGDQFGDYAYHRPIYPEGAQATWVSAKQ